MYSPYHIPVCSCIPVIASCRLSSGMVGKYIPWLERKLSTDESAILANVCMPGVTKTPQGSGSRENEGRVGGERVAET